MGKRCGCVGSECNCTSADGSGLDIVGTGSQDSPYVVSVGDQAMKLTGLSTAYMTLGVGGSGTATNPYVIDMDKTGVADPELPANVNQFLTSGVWVRPSWVSLIEVTLIGAGGGGGGGDSASPEGNANGGFGGFGGGWTRSVLNLAAGITHATVTIGIGGAGGPGTTSASTTYAGGAGTPTVITFMIGETPSFSVRAGGGYTYVSAGYGTKYGQNAVIFAGYTSEHRTFSGAGGGNGGKITSAGTPTDRQLGHLHGAYDDANSLLVFGAGKGGDGGQYSFNAASGGLDGQVGGIGGGGGGGGAGMTPFGGGFGGVGGDGGAGGNGAAWIVSL